MHRGRFRLGRRIRQNSPAVQHFGGSILPGFDDGATVWREAQEFCIARVGPLGPTSKSEFNSSPEIISWSIKYASVKSAICRSSGEIATAFGMILIMRTKLFGTSVLQILIALSSYLVKAATKMVRMITAVLDMDPLRRPVWMVSFVTLRKP